MNITIVKYLGNEIEVPSNMNYIAVDGNGSVFAYENKPEITRGFWEVPDDGDIIELGKVEFRNFGDWRESLATILHPQCYGEM